MVNKNEALVGAREGVQPIVKPPDLVNLVDEALNALTNSRLSRSVKPKRENHFSECKKMDSWVPGRFRIDLLDRQHLFAS
ncbi:hypothetical protein AKJ16_DCAP15932 [Drosera capensis]